MLLVPRWMDLALVEVSLNENWLLQESTWDPDRRQYESLGGLEQDL